MTLSQEVLPMRKNDDGEQEISLCTAYFADLGMENRR